MAQQWHNVRDGSLPLAKSGKRCTINDANSSHTLINNTKKKNRLFNILKEYGKSEVERIRIKAPTMHFMHKELMG